MLGICERKRRRAAEDVFELLLEVSAGALHLVEIPVREAIYREGDRGRLGHDLSVLALPPGPAPRVHEIADSVDELAWLERRIGRILSERGHLSNDDCAALAADLAREGTRQIMLGHLSRENNTPGKAMAETGAALLGTDTELYCAPVLGCLTVEIQNEVQTGLLL